jgi:poly(hydroxyalkanoate) granule-associated protein
MEDKDQPVDEAGHGESWEDWIPSEIRGPIDGVKRLALASLGAVVLATETTDEFFQELVKRGERAKDEVAHQLHDARDRSASRRDNAGTYVRSRMDAVLNRVNMPSKADVDSINAKLNILTRKVDEIQASQVDKATGRQPRHSEPPAGAGTP